jgi:outer membrane biosynthesis protein TonB
VATTSAVVGPASAGTTKRPRRATGTASSDDGDEEDADAVLKAATSSGTSGAAPETVTSNALPGTRIGGATIDINRPGMEAPLTDKAEIVGMAKRIIEAYQPQVDNCYSQRLKSDENLEGAWKVTFTITPDGAVSKASVAGVDRSDRDLEACLVRAVASWRFQKIDRNFPIAKTWHLTPGW